MVKVKTVWASLLALLAMLVAMPQAAYAALPAGVSDAVEAYETDMLALIALLIAAGIAIWGAKKLGQKMGWWT